MASTSENPNPQISENPNPQIQTETQQVVVQMPSTSTIPPKFKAKKPKIKAKRKLPEAVASSTSKERSWVWEHFSKFDKPIMEIIDKKPIQVVIQKRAKCN
ncbi:hypothetical protein M0R45_022001 [Rubus argutus]|uniref:Uncharacterized protein n=1 Tax=Rubus argutus TaxID=59490 RepID=A0AAW1XE31_RUBAR